VSGIGFCQLPLLQAMESAELSIVQNLPSGHLVLWSLRASKHECRGCLGNALSIDSVRHWRTVRCVEFVETPTFTRLIGKLMSDDEYARLQLALALRPAWGKLIPGSGGLRKLRWAGSGRGKRGGLRVIYYWQVANNQIWLLVAYPKSERDDLSHYEIRQLKHLVEELEA
jgi:mRNA-degrading endonuclease RelE of RelBE toxin-antitoxin system